MEPIFDALQGAVSSSDFEMHETKRRAYEALLKRQHPEKGTVEGVVDLKDHLRRIVLILLPDLNCADENIASFALRCLGFYMHQSSFTSTIGDAKVQSVLDALITSIKETNSKVRLHSTQRAAQQVFLAVNLKVFRETMVCREGTQVDRLI
jgi:hypothetical protein